MAVRLLDALLAPYGELRFEPTPKRIRASLMGQAVADSSRTLLVWEPNRVLPSYAFPYDGISAEFVPRPGDVIPDPEAPAVLHGATPFSVHTTPGAAYDLRVGDRTLEAAAFTPSDPALAGYAVLDWEAFDAWHEEEERVVSHPRDPFHRVDTRRSSRHVRIELGGHLLAESTRPTLVFETRLPTRYYLPREDVEVPLHPSPKRTFCAYKGEAQYWSPEVAGQVHENLAWGYEHPLADAPGVRGLICFFNEKVDITVDGEREALEHTPTSSSILDEAGV